ncbi:MAG: acyltransferase family protein [Porticoccaceae bacterium]
MLQKDISDRIWITRYLMVIGIVVLHLPVYQSLSSVGVNGAFDYFKAFFAHGVFRATVPVLTVMSGYLLFRSGLDRQYLSLLKSKTNSLLIPLLIWNLPLALIVFVLQKYQLGSHSFSVKLYPIEGLSWLNAVTGLHGTPVNYPLNFLRDLFAVSLLAPVLGLLLRRSPYVGLALVMLVYFFNLDGPFVIRNSMLVSFYLGGLAYTQNWDLAALDRYAPVLLALFLASCAMIVLLKIQNREWFRLISPFLVWPSMAMLMGTAPGRFLLENSRSSFFTFLAHGPILLLLWFVFQKWLSGFPYMAYWFAAPVLTVYGCILFSGCTKKWFPRITAFALGGR